jgi:transposase
MTRASEWAERVSSWRASGQSAAEFCRGKPYTKESLYVWSSTLKRKQVEANSRSSKVALARVVRAPAASESRGLSVVVTTSRGQLELRGPLDAQMVQAMVAMLTSESGVRS